jgi:signal transduction histidine kinase/CheY-like chemotaxis protein
MRFRTVLILYVSLVIALVLGAAMGAVAIVLGRSALRQASAELARARVVLDEDAARRRELIGSQAAVMAEEPRLKAVVVTQDINPETVLDVAGDLRRELRVDRFVIGDADGNVIADVGRPAPRPPLARDPVVASALADGVGSGVWVDGGHAWEVAARRLVFGQTSVGFVAIGYPIDDALVAGFERQTLTHAVVLAGARRLAGTVATGAADLAAVGAAPVELDVVGAPVLAMAADLGPLRVVLLRPLDEALAARQALVAVIVAIAAAALALALVGAGLLGRRLSRPLDRLVAFTRKIADGQLDARVDPGPAPTEIEALAESMNLMARKLEESKGRLILADRMASVGTLASGVAHEINNPLAWVMGNLEFLADELPALFAGLPRERRAELEDVLAQTKDGADRVRKIVRDLKLFSRADEEQRGPVDVHAVLELAVNMTRAELKHRAHLVRAYGEVPPVLANEARLGQVFVNLLVNAAQAITEGRFDANEVRLGTHVGADGRVVIEVADTGAGIPDAIRDRIFDPFFTTKQVGIGTGLGLSICHGIVTAAGGEIQVDSTVGKGTIVRVILPAASAPVAAAAAPSAPARGPRGRILVVDDEPQVAAMLQRELAAEHDVEVAASGRAALDRLAEAQSFDVILCDLMMPEVTGMALHAALAERAPHLLPRLAFVTGGAFTPGGRAFLDEVPNPRFEKPVDLQALRAFIHARVDQR